jgi:hypothetical protein
MFSSPLSCLQDVSDVSACAQAYVFDTVLQLAADPIANVRLQLLELLPRLKQTLRLPDHVDRLVRRLSDLNPHPTGLNAQLRLELTPSWSRLCYAVTPSQPVVRPQHRQERCDHSHAWPHGV